MEQPGRSFGYTMAKQFSQMFNFQNVINGFFLPDKMPTFGQLGCSGFIVAEISSGKVIHKATPALMQHGSPAFSWVEKMFHTLVPTLPAAKESPPADAIRVQVEGLKSQPSLNGMKGYLIRKDESNPQRFIVLLDNGQQVSLKPANFNDVDPEDEEVQNNDAHAIESKAADGSSSTACASGGDCSACTTGCSKDVLSDLIALVTPKLGFALIDEEHQECDDALAELLQVKTVDKLVKFRVAVNKHFQHEEALMQEADFGGAKQSIATGNNLSAYVGHVSDHKSIMSLLESVEEEYKVTGEAFVCRDSLVQVAQRFKSHIEKYDMLYHDSFVAAGIQ